MTSKILATFIAMVLTTSAMAGSQKDIVDTAGAAGNFNALA